MNIAEAWEELEAWLQEDAPEVDVGLRQGASEEELSRLEELVGQPLPESFAAIYSRHDGQEPDSPGLFDAGEFLSLDRLQKAWESAQATLITGPPTDLGELSPIAEPGIRAAWWDSGWIPFCASGRGDYLCLDLNPAPGGNRGQVIRVWHDDPAREMRAPDLAHWFIQRSQSIIRGDYVHSGAHEGLMRWEDL